MVAFVFSGGASRGAVQVGMVQALHEAGIRPDALYGTSIGALNATALAHGYTQPVIDGLYATWEAFADAAPVRPSLVSQIRATLRRDISLASMTDAIPRLRRRFALDRLEDAVIPLSITATSLATGAERIFREGPLVDTLLASCAVPGLFPPVELDGELYVDGLLSGAPVGPAIADGHEEIYLLLTNAPMPSQEMPRTWWGVARRATTMVMWQQLTIPRSHGQRKAIVHVIDTPPSLRSVRYWDFSESRQLIADARRAATNWLDARG